MNLPLYQLVSINPTITSTFARSSSSSPTWPLSTSLPTWRPAVRRGRNPPRWKGTWQWQNAIEEFPIETFIYKGFFYCYVWFQEGMSDKKRFTWSNVFPPNLIIYIYLNLLWCWQFFSIFGFNTLQQLVCPDKKNQTMGLCQRRSVCGCRMSFLGGPL